MDTPDRLAAYLAGDLSAADAAAVEQDLARDATLRAELEAMRRADTALGELGSPRAPAGFEQRLRDHLDPVLADELGTSAQPGTATAPMGTFDELAERRAVRSAGPRRRWVPAVAGVAAAAAAVMVLTNLDLGGDDADQALTDTAEMDTTEESDDSAETFSDEAGDEEMAEDGAAPPAPDGPTVVVDDRELDEDAIEALLAAPELQGVAAQGYRDGAAAEVADEWALALGADAGAALSEDAPAGAEESEDAGDDAADTDADSGDDAADGSAEPEADDGELAGGDPAPLRTMGDRPLSDAEQADVARCLSRLTDDVPGGAIPAYVEFGSYDGDEVIVFGFVTEDPETGAYTRTEAWVVGRDDCEVRHWRQR